MDCPVWTDQRENQALKESKGTQAQSEKLVDLEPPVKMVLKENRDYLAEMVGMVNPAPQDSKVNLARPTSEKISNDQGASQQINLVTKQLWIPTII
jgi:hypothetical protein